MDGLPTDNGAFGFFKPLLWAAAGDTSLNVRFLLNWLLRNWIVWSCQELNVLLVIKKDSDLELSQSRTSGELSPTALMNLK